MLWSNIQCSVMTTWKAQRGFMAVLGKRKQNKGTHTLKIWRDGGVLTCAIMCYSITHSIRDSSEWLIGHTNHLCSQVSFLFPTPAALLPVQTTPAPSLPFIVLRHTTEPRQCSNHKNPSLLCCISPSGCSWDHDGKSHSTLGCTTALLTLLCLLVEYKVRRNLPGDHETYCAGF